MGLRYNTTFLHDGRSTTLSDAIVQHDGPGSEASAAAKCFAGLAPQFQKQMLDFLGDL
jgi:CxxC motif-containing protein (DUF1111 family)